MLPPNERNVQNQRTKENQHPHEARQDESSGREDDEDYDCFSDSDEEILNPVIRNVPPHEARQDENSDEEVKEETNEIGNKRTWNYMFARLKTFKSKYNHCRVSSTVRYSELYGYPRYKLAPYFGYWVKIQRSLFSAGKLDPEHEKDLTEIGFVWNVHDEVCGMMFERLLSYKKEHGNCHVPHPPFNDPKLENWVVKQRTTTKNQLPQERYEKLSSIRFVWNAREEKWNEMFEQLKVYKQNNGHCLVLQSYVNDP